MRLCDYVPKNPNAYTLISLRAHKRKGANGNLQVRCGQFGPISPNTPKMGYYVVQTVGSCDGSSTRWRVNLKDPECT